MADIDLTAFRNLYFDTSKSYLLSLEGSYQRLLLSNNDSEAINQAYISSHSLKSQSHVMGYFHFSNLAGILEHVFRAIKDGNLQYKSEISDVLGRSIISLKTSIETLEKNGDDPNTSDIVSQVAKATGITYPEIIV